MQSMRTNFACMHACTHNPPAVRQLAVAGRAQADQSCDDQILEWQLSSGAAAVRGINPSTGLTAAFHFILFYSHPIYWKCSFPLYFYPQMYLNLQPKR